ncbi:AraC family transcriptional regulator [Ruminiclostridium cellobioparum]|uniref:AraC family transcriptional regulator n=1 Tax=Ruminiclostridium cellobioparum TaxID=29355 RepID=UPI0028A753AE|nr:AraC family transcriptional regulator [Ruminiclostridium cellobioparum]
MADFQYGSNRENYDLGLYHCGMEVCRPGHYYGPAVRDHYLIHYIMGGKGIFKYGEKIYRLEKGQGFLICPGKVTYYQADTAEPWSYCWVGFTGYKASYYLEQARLNQEEPVFRYDRDSALADCILQMVETYETNIWNETKILSLLYLFLTYLIDEAGIQPINRQIENRQEFYVKKVIEYVEMNYSRKIKISDIAAYIGLDRSYLGSVFREYTQKSLQQFLLEYRMNKACLLMRDRELAISDISRSVGYDDPLLFSKMFKRVKGKSPKQFRAYQPHT